MLKLKGDALPGAWICNSQDRGRRAIKDKKIYLDQNQEFIIELFNPLQRSILADIKIEGQSVSSTGLVINPGQRAYLECFVDDKRKFIYKTYNVDGGDKVVQNAIMNNGLVEIFFYEEQVINYYPNWTTLTINGQYSNPISWTTYPSSYYYNGVTTTGNLLNSTYTIPNNGYVGTLTGSLTGTTTTGNVNYTTATTMNPNLFGCGVTNTSNISNTLETGKVERGSKSNQKFNEVYKNFNSFILNKIEYKLLPTSQKPHEPEVKKPVNNWKDTLIQLSDLQKAGILTTEEYEKKKSEILSRI